MQLATQPGMNVILGHFSLREVFLPLLRISSQKEKQQPFILHLMRIVPTRKEHIVQTFFIYFLNQYQTVIVIHKRINTLPSAFHCLLFLQLFQELQHCGIHLDPINRYCTEKEKPEHPLLDLLSNLLLHWPSIRVGKTSARIRMLQVESCRKMPSRS